MSCQQTQPWGCRGTGLSGQILSAPWGSELKGWQRQEQEPLCEKQPRQSPESHQLLCPSMGAPRGPGPTPVLAGPLAAGQGRDDA